MVTYVHRLAALLVAALLLAGCPKTPNDELVYFTSRAPTHLVPILDANEEAKYPVSYTHL